ncbi:MAG: GMP synthase (glutamine-hydrolyzing) [Candidatus Margulisiibacteriota bacterium]|nr:MAG: GMP synthase (glutamine-hydrolyzing) [Candidatus Margulisiibacteriota bacterium]HAR62609.1 GMP synthase (glutamine-hydrolyzing) [Candidatus Margulisiibacteriota bacterium]HCT84335.1 GMP synthase (glutamine-hydrolyzing) [Candidatus Margulisiibacteriota bacterium]HCY35755.1 GMP synthase (glutamine-hydrolyzing) [Candidatus Margulisiibacteriota bacterium]
MVIVILDFGSQYTELIARRVRECKVYSEILPSSSTPEDIRKFNPSGIIISGGPSSVYDEDAPKLNKDIYKMNLPILGICYGMQLLANDLGGEVQKKDTQEYGKSHLMIDDNFDLFEGLWLEMVVWMSHGDAVVKLPEGFKAIAHTANCPIAGMANRKSQFFGVQFHPEVAHTPKGMEIIRNFVFKICGCLPTWTTTSFVRDSIKEIRQIVGKDKVLLGLSGGVDSTTAAALIHEAIGDQLVCMFIDQGFMRKNEGVKIVKMFRDYFKINLVHIDACERFYNKLDKVIDPEEKRKVIGHEFVRTFEEEAKNLKTEIPFLAQGTLYPDVIESATSGTSQNAVKIKTHHNVGGLPDDIQFKVIEPLRKLFKDEVRKVAAELNVPDEIVHRQPFPGPGLAIRIIGEVTKERIKVLQDADDIIMDEIKKAGYYRKVWQAFGVLLPIRTVGVMGDKRTYLSTLALRVVTSEDAMTANWADLPYELLEKISTRVINEVGEINRVVYDITSKPPGTIEWE